MVLCSRKNIHFSVNYFLFNFSFSYFLQRVSNSLQFEMFSLSMTFVLSCCNMCCAFLTFVSFVSPFCYSGMSIASPVSCIGKIFLPSASSTTRGFPDHSEQFKVYAPAFLTRQLMQRAREYEIPICVGSQASRAFVGPFSSAPFLADAAPRARTRRTPSTVRKESP